jgi:hypothetical protein
LYRVPLLFSPQPEGGFTVTSLPRDRPAETQAMATLPANPHFFAALDTTLSPERVAAPYGALGWRIRKCSWVDYEVSSDRAEPVIESEAPILVYGSVAELPARAEEVVAPLRAAGVVFTAECCGPDPACELLLELRS